MPKYLLHIGRIAQSVEQGIENPRVGGSIPPPATILFSSLRVENQKDPAEIVAAAFSN